MWNRLCFFQVPNPSSATTDKAALGQEFDSIYSEFPSSLVPLRLSNPLTDACIRVVDVPMSRVKFIVNTEYTYPQNLFLVQNLPNVKFRPGRDLRLSKADPLLASDPSHIPFRLRISTRPCLRYASDVACLLRYWHARPSGPNMYHQNAADAIALRYMWHRLYLGHGQMLPVHRPVNQLQYATRTVTM